MKKKTQMIFSTLIIYILFNFKCKKIKKILTIDTIFLFNGLIISWFFFYKSKHYFVSICWFLTGKGQNWIPNITFIKHWTEKKSDLLIYVCVKL